MIISVDRFRKILAGAAVAGWVILGALPLAAQAATTTKSAKKAVVAKSVPQRASAAAKKTQPKVAQSKASRATAVAAKQQRRVKVQLAAGKSGTLHKVVVQRKASPAPQAAVARAAIAPSGPSRPCRRPQHG